MKKYAFAFVAMVAASVAAACVPPASETEPIEQPIVGGTMAGACMWPSCVSGSGCTNTLIHPRIVTTARHCLGGTPRSITFGETRNAGVRSVAIERCVRHPMNDVGFCVLREPVNDVPIVPVLAACEARDMIRNGQPAVLVGYGNLRSGVSSGGRKYFVELAINALVNNGREVDLGNAQRGACNGDSGGPAYLRMPDGTWRAFGVTSRKGPGGGNCASSTIYGLISAHIDWIEQESGMDITPCHGPGGWEDGPNCDRFPTDPGGTAGGTWMTMCSAGPVAKPMPTCTGGPIPPVPDGGGSPPRPTDARPGDATGARMDTRAERTADVATDTAADVAPPPPPAPDANTFTPDTAPASPPPPPPPPPAPPPPPPPPPGPAPAAPDAGTPARPGNNSGGCSCSLGLPAGNGARGGGAAGIALMLVALGLHRTRRRCQER